MLTRLRLRNFEFRADAEDVAALQRERWIGVTPADYIEIGDSVEAGELISPYDLPNGVRGGYDEDGKRFVVEFRYMVDEKYRVAIVEGGIRVRLGKYSSRIVGVEVDLERLRNAQATVPFEGRSDDPYAAIDSVIQNVEELTNGRARRRLNYRVTQQVLEDNLAHIFGGMRQAVVG